MPSLPDQWSISSEPELWALLEQLLAAPDQPPVRIRIQGWNPELLYFPDEPIGHTVTPSIARAISEFHTSLLRAYAYLEYGKPSARLLKSEDKERLDVQFLISDGSNGVVALSRSLDAIAEALSKMTGEQVTICIVVLILVYFSSTVGKSWISSHYNDKRESKAEASRIKLTEEETRRMKLMTDALTRAPRARPLTDLADDAKEALVRPAIDVPRTRVVGAEVTSDEAKVVLLKQRSKATGHRLDGVFQVTEIDNESAEGYSGHFRNVATGEEFNAEINYADLTEEDIRALFAALKDKSNVEALINAWFVGDKVSRAIVMRANDEKKDAKEIEIEA